MKSHSEKCTFDKSETDATFPCTCDGYHTFDELYDHRITLYISLCKQIVRQPYDNEGKFFV